MPDFFCLIHQLFSWRVLSKEECPARCGTGMRYQAVHCIKQIGFKTAEIVNDKECVRLHGVKPDAYVPCEGKCLATYWTYTDWSQVKFVSFYNSADTSIIVIFKYIYFLLIMYLFIKYIIPPEDCCLCLCYSLQLMLLKSDVLFYSFHLKSSVQ